MKLFSFFKKDNRQPAYKCTSCGIAYDALPLCFGADFPEYYFSVPEEEWDSRVVLKKSLCVIDQQHFFHRGRLTIPIIDHSENLAFDVWTTINAENFQKRMGLWEDSSRMNEEPYFGWLQTSVPTYGDTLNIKTVAVEQEVGAIPEITSIEEGHRLTMEQENGITYNRAIEIVNEIMREQHKGNG